MKHEDSSDTSPRQAGRRDFMKRLAAGTATAGLLRPAMADSPSIPPGEPVEASRMPLIRLGSQMVSRLILGANPQWGYSHRGTLLSQLMTDWYTPDRVVEVLHHAERCGINTWQSSVSGHFVKDWVRYRDEGGRMNLILLVHSAAAEWPEVRRQILPLQSLAMVHHGGDTDRYWKEGRIDRVEDELKRYRDDGVLAGCSSHLPEVIAHISDKNWDLDFFMTCFYQISLGPEDWQKQYGFVPLHEMYTRSMPAEMAEVIRQVTRPCLAFKILAASRACDRRGGLDEAFRFAFENIKPSDGVIVGMFPARSDQISENANLTIRHGQLPKQWTAPHKA